MSVADDRIEGLANACAPDLLAYFVRRVPAREDAADLLSETFVVLWRRRRDVPEDDHQARLWLFGVARKVLATHRRSSVRRHGVADRLRQELTLTPRSPGTEDPRLIGLAQELEALHEQDREIIRLVHWDGFTLAEAAQLLGRRPGTVRSRYHRARATLRSRLAATTCGVTNS